MSTAVARGATVAEPAPAAVGPSRRLPHRPDVLVPAAIFYLAIVIYPITYSACLSFFRWDGIAPRMTFVGLRNYNYLLHFNPVFWIALKNNAIWIACALVIPNSIGFSAGTRA